MHKHDMAVTVTVPEATFQLPEDQALLVFQSVRELLVNAESTRRRHGRHHHGAGPAIACAYRYTMMAGALTWRRPLRPRRQPSSRQNLASSVSASG